MSSRPSSGTSLSSRFILYYLVAFLVGVGLIGLVVDRTVRSTLVEGVDEDLEAAARLATESLSDDPTAYQEWARSSFAASSFRLTLIATDGTVLADSHSDPAVMENHRERPEVLTAFAGEVGLAERISDSTGFAQRYLALPPQDGLVVRASVPLRVVDDQLASLRLSLLIGGGALGALGLALVVLLARRSAQPIRELTSWARTAVEGANVDLVPVQSGVRELDGLGLAISTMANRLGARVRDAEEASATLEVVLGALPQGTVLFGGDEVVLYANPASYSILGAVPNQLSGLAPLQLQNAVREAKSSREPVVRLLDHGSPPRRLRAVATPFSSDERVLLLIVDVTERERADTIRRDFVANASHELKTPVATIIASSEALQIALDREDPSAAGFAARIESSARQLDRLVTDLLDLSRLERESPEMAPLRLDHLVREESGRISAEIERKGLELEVATIEVTVVANHRDVSIAVRNVLDNAVRYTSEGGSVTVSVGSNGDGAFVTVSDTGEGIPIRDHERVFERFYRVDSARSRGTGGTGLGLSIVRHVAESHGGSVALESQLGVGSTFTIRLPLGGKGESPVAN